MTLEQVRNDLKEIKYYHSHRKMLETSFAYTGQNVFVEKLERYNKSVCNAPLKLHEVYVGLHIDGYSQEELAERLGVTRVYIYQLNKELVSYFAANLTQGGAEE